MRRDENGDPVQIDVISLGQTPGSLDQEVYCSLFGWF